MGNADPDGLFANEEAPRLQKVADVVAGVLKLGDWNM